MKNNPFLVLIVFILFFVLMPATVFVKNAVAAQDSQITMFDAKLVGENVLEFKWNVFTNSQTSVVLVADCPNGSITFNNLGYIQSCDPNGYKSSYGYAVGFNTTGYGPSQDPSIFLNLNKTSEVTIVSNSKKQNIPFTLLVIKDGEIIKKLVKKISIPQYPDPKKKQSVTVITPDGGEVVHPGDKLKIQWKTKGVPFNPGTQVDILDDRIKDFITSSLFGTVPALEYSNLVGVRGDEYTYEYMTSIPDSFRDSLPYQYRNIFGGGHYKVSLTVLTGGRTISDLSNKKFSIVKPR